MTKNTKNILSIAVILALITSCSTTKEIPNLDEATFTAMRYENGLAGKKKQLLRAGGCAGQLGHRSPGHPVHDRQLGFRLQVL